MTDFITEFDSKNSFLESCDLPEEEFTIEPFVLVIFGGAGDLSQRKLLPTIYEIFTDGELPEDFAIIGAGQPAMGDKEFRGLIRNAL